MISPAMILTAALFGAAPPPPAPPHAEPALPEVAIVLAVDEKSGIVILDQPPGMDEVAACQRELVMVDGFRSARFDVDAKGDEARCAEARTTALSALKKVASAHGIDLDKAKKVETVPVPRGSGAIRSVDELQDGSQCSRLLIDGKEVAHDCRFMGEPQENLPMSGMSSYSYWWWRVGKTPFFLELVAESSRQTVLSWEVVDTRAKNWSDPATFAPTGVDVAGLKALTIPPACNIGVVATLTMTTPHGVTGALSLGLTRDEKKPVYTGLARKSRAQSVVYAKPECTDAAKAIAAKIPGGAGVEPLLWKSKSAIVVAVGADADPHF